MCMLVLKKVLLSSEVLQRVNKDSELLQDKKRFICLGKLELPVSPDGISKLFEMKVRGLEARFFGGVTFGEHSFHNSSSNTSRQSISGQERNSDLHNDASHKSDKSNNGADENNDKSTSARDPPHLQMMMGEGMAFKEDLYLTSANLCRWIIDFSEIQLGKQIGMGSYGVVYRGKWKGVDIAVKRFIKQKLDESSMLEIRAEMAFLSELHHPNIVMFIGACVRRPNLCIMTEFVKQGSMKDILQNTTVKLPWMRRLRMLRSAALGINYLHTLTPVIIHRDLKPSNLLVRALCLVHCLTFLYKTFLIDLNFTFLY